jgi:hypothetical protein
MIVKKKNKELLEVVAQNKFGICPMCNSPTMLLRSNYSAYHLSESGWITSQTDSKTEFKFIVDINNEDGDDFRFMSIIKSQEQLSQFIQQTIEALKLYPKFNKYVTDLENCL